MSLTTSPASLRLAPSASQGTPTTLVVPGGPATQPGNGMTLGPAVSGVNTTVPQSPAPGTLAGAVLGAHRTTQAGGTGGTDSDSEDDLPAAVTFHVRKPDPDDDDPKFVMFHVRKPDSAQDLQDALQAFAPGDAKAYISEALQSRSTSLRPALPPAKAKEAEFQRLPDDVMRIVGDYAQTRLPDSLRKFSGLMALPAPEDLKNLKQLTRVNEPTWVLASHWIKDKWLFDPEPAICDPEPALCMWHGPIGNGVWHSVLLFEANLAKYTRGFPFYYCETPDFQGKLMIAVGSSSKKCTLWADPDAPTGKPAIEFASFNDFFKDFDFGKPQDVLVRCSVTEGEQGDIYHAIVPRRIDVNRRGERGVLCKLVQEHPGWPTCIRIVRMNRVEDSMLCLFPDRAQFAKSPFPRRIETPIQQAPEETPKPKPPGIKPLTPAEVRSIRAVGIGGTFTIADAYVTIISHEDGPDGGELVGLHAATASDYLLHLSGATTHPEKLYRGYLYKIPLPKTEA